MSKIHVATIALIITRDAMTILPTTVPKHELPMLQTVFGEDNVQVADDQSSAALPVEIDAEGEVTRLENKFGPGALEKTHGAAYKNAILREMKDNTVESADAEALDQALDAMTKDELLAEAAKRGVKADPSMTKARIIEAIETAHLA